jgi:hypothetical protein
MLGMSHGAHEWIGKIEATTEEIVETIAARL